MTISTSLISGDERSYILLPAPGIYCVAHNVKATITAIKDGFRTAFLIVNPNSFFVNLTPDSKENEKPKPPI